MPRYEEDLAFAQILADIAARIALPRFQSLDLAVSTKPDLTPVSDADTAVEQALRAEISRRFPQDLVLGEEFGDTGLKPSDTDDPDATPARRRWIVDPIDATKNFIRGVPVWGSLIALLEDEQPIVGVVSAPALNRRWWAAQGSGAWTRNGDGEATRIRVSEVSRLADASCCYSSLGGWESAGLLPAMLDLFRDTWRQRAFGDFFGYMLLAEGAVDIMVEPELSPWDLAALIPIVREAGGTLTSLDGRPGPYGGSGVATNGRLHQEVLSRLSPGQRREPGLPPVPGS